MFDIDKNASCSESDQENTSLLELGKRNKEMAVGQNPGTPVNIPKEALKIDYFHPEKGTHSVLTQVVTRVPGF